MLSKTRPWTAQEVTRDFLISGGGQLLWNSGPRKGKTAGYSDKSGRVYIRYKGVLVAAANLSWLYNTGVWPALEVDHVDNNPSNNSFSNLRLATRQENVCNQKLQARRSGKYKGVHSSNTLKESYYVKIKQDGVQKYGGTFASESEAALQYNILAEGLFGNFAHFNSVFEDYALDPLDKRVG